MKLSDTEHTVLGRRVEKAFNELPSYTEYRVFEPMEPCDDSKSPAIGYSDRRSLSLFRQVVAVKKLDVTSEPDSNNEFLTQVLMVSRLKNENLVKLVGYCVDENLPLLAYEVTDMGSLHDILHGSKGVQEAQPGRVLDWMQQVRIVVDAARGLEYLQEKAHPSIIHGDIRSSNVLVFED